MTDSLAQTMAPIVRTEDGERPLTADEQRQYERDADTWWTANSLPALGQLTADWLEGRSLFLPAYCATGPDPETTDLIPTLAALNRAGLVTDSSQPGHGPVEGYDGRMWLQRAYVSGYTDAGTIHSLAAALAHHDDLILVPARQTRGTQTGPRPRLLPGHDPRERRHRRDRRVRRQHRRRTHPHPPRRERALPRRTQPGGDQDAATRLARHRRRSRLQRYRLAVAGA